MRYQNMEAQYDRIEAMLEAASNAPDTDRYGPGKGDYTAVDTRPAADLTYFDRFARAPHCAGCGLTPAAGCLCDLPPAPTDSGTEDGDPWLYPPETTEPPSGPNGRPEVYVAKLAQLAAERDGRGTVRRFIARYLGVQDSLRLNAALRHLGWYQYDGLWWAPPKTV